MDKVHLAEPKNDIEEVKSYLSMYSNGIQQNALYYIQQLEEKVVELEKFRTDILLSLINIIENKVKKEINEMTIPKGVDRDE